MEKVFNVSNEQLVIIGENVYHTLDYNDYGMFWLDAYDNLKIEGDGHIPTINMIDDYLKRYATNLYRTWSNCFDEDDWDKVYNVIERELLRLIKEELEEALENWLNFVIDDYNKTKC